MHELNYKKILQTISTKDLVQELATRAGVTVSAILPHEEKVLHFSGPAIVVKVID